MADEEDPVEHELDVFLSKSLAENLYLFQFPVRPSSLTYEDIKPLSAKVKPSQQKVQLELPVNSSSNNYATSKGEQLALNIDGISRGEDGSYFKSGVMDKQILSSGPSPASAKRYAVAILKDGEIHVTPLKGMVQLRPEFSYLDRADVKQKELAGAAAAGDAGEDFQEEMEDVKQVTVKFARQETAEGKARRLASFAYVNKKREDEQWTNVHYNNLQSDTAETERMLLYASQSHDLSELQMEPRDYLQHLLPAAINKSEEKPGLPSNVLSLVQLRGLPLVDQVKALLLSAKVIRFHQLLTLLPQGTDAQAVLRSLRQVAVLVQGCWVVKSEILYPKEACSHHSGISAEHICRGRDYVMWRFTQTRHVTRKDVSSVIKLPPEDVKDILEQMSRLRANHGWEFLLDTDKEFLDRYPEVVSRQKMLWDAKSQVLCKQLKLNSKDLEKSIKDEPGSMSYPEKPKRQRTTSRSSRKRTLSGGRSDHSDIEMESVRKLSEIHTDINNIKTDSATSSDDVEIIGVTKEPIANGPSSNYPCSPELRTELQNFVQEKLHSRLILALSELKRLFILKLAQLPAGHILGTGVSDKLLEETLVDVGGSRVDNQWPPHCQSEPLFAKINNGDHLDKSRSILLNLFEGSYRLKSTTFKKKVEDDTNETFSETECKKVLKDDLTARCVIGREDVKLNRRGVTLDLPNGQPFMLDSREIYYQTN